MRQNSIAPSMARPVLPNHMAESSAVKDPAPPPPDPPAPSAQADFADVSHYEANIDWDKYAASGRKMAICKYTEGDDYVDATAADNRAAMNRLGLSCGLYHFAGNSAANKIHDPVAEADFFLSQVGTLGPKEFPVLDFELPYHMTPSRQIKWINAWCTEIQDKTGKAPWIYTDEYMLSKMDPVEATPLTKFPLWIADYNMHDPKNPPPTAPWAGPAAWQYTFKADIPGIGSCDDSYLYAEPPGSGSPTPAPTPPTPAPTPAPPSPSPAP